MVKLIAVDLDGTLLNEDKKISKRNLEAIKYAQANGIEVVIATGRSHFDVNEIFKDTNIKTWIISANGATIHQPNGELYHSVSINLQEAKEILEWIEKEKYYYEVSSNDYIYTPEYGRQHLLFEMEQLHRANPDLSLDEMKKAADNQYGQSGFSFIKSYKDLLSMNVDFFNILAYSFDKEKLAKGMENFKKYQDLSVVKSDKNNFEIQHREVSKGNALMILANKLNINLSQTAAVGDNFNDLSMLKIAGKSAAMGNAHPDIQKCCHEVTLTNHADGVAHFIDSLTQKIRHIS